ncbi:amino acid permease [Naumannella sp. ID2617S]|nr:amino acid permease [Naumannella sp. ID2617S]
MIGAGVFAVWVPAAQVAGVWLLLGLAIALMVAYCNATSSAQLAAQYPTSGGTYVYGRERLGEWPGFLAGWGFVVGKTASVAAMALTFGQYLATALGVPDIATIGRSLAMAAVLVLAAVNCLGVTRTARLTRIIVVIVLAVLVVAMVNNVAWPMWGWVRLAEPGPIGPYQVLQSAGLLFFAFAGYARIATMGEEVVEPRRTIPRAILIALSLTAVVYFVVGAVLLRGGAQWIAAAQAPLALSRWHSVTLVVTVGAALATAGAMLNLMTGIGRTSLAMARNRDLPGWLAVIEPRHQVPRRAEVVLAVVVCALLLIGDLRTVIGFSSFGVLIYYCIANLAALTQGPADRRFGKPLQVLGAVLCLVLVATLPWQSVVGGLIMYAVGAAYRLLTRAHRKHLAP